MNVSHVPAAVCNNMRTGVQILGKQACTKIILETQFINLTVIPDEDKLTLHRNKRILQL